MRKLIYLILVLLAVSVTLSAGDLIVNNDNIVKNFDIENDNSLEITLQVKDGFLVLYLTGYIDTYNSTIFQVRVEKAVNAGFNNLIF